MLNVSGMIKGLALTAAIGFASAASVQAIPTLQVGTSGPPGTYADYEGSLTDPTETDTAVGSGSPFTLYVGGVYKNDKDLLLGGQYTDPVDSTVTPDISPGTPGDNWSEKGYDSAFNTSGAIVMATAPAPAGPATITVDGLLAFYTTTTFEGGFIVPNPPANHDPIKDNSPTDNIYMFFDIGNFANAAGVVPNFVDETGGADGEVKSLEVLISGFEWVHFDAFALMTRLGNDRGDTVLVSSLEGNPGSKDVTWKDDGGGGGGGDPIPEPGTIVLLGGGLLGLALYGRRSRRS